MIWEKMSRGLKSLLDFDEDDFRLRPCLIDPLLVLLDAVSPGVGVGLTLRSTLLRRPAMVTCSVFYVCHAQLLGAWRGESCRVSCAKYLAVVSRMLGAHASTTS